MCFMVSAVTHRRCCSSIGFGLLVSVTPWHLESAGHVVVDVHGLSVVVGGDALSELDVTFYATETHVTKCYVRLFAVEVDAGVHRTACMLYCRRFYQSQKLDMD